jgi:hypothetical protein
MPLTEEIKIAALELGQALRQDDDVLMYLDALRECQSDPVVSALEKKMYDVYEGLIARQQAGEQLSQEETSAFYELRQQVLSHPLIFKRHEMLRFIRPRLAQIAEEISFVLGVDFAAIVRIE